MLPSLLPTFPVMKHTLFLLLLLPLAACGSPEPDADVTTDELVEVAPTGMAQVAPTSADGASVSGELMFTPEGDGVRLTGTLSGLTASGIHGFHLHENGACGPSDDGTPGGAAGGHWDPLGTMNHDGPGADFMTRHAGDLGNVTADADGNATFDLMLPNLSTDGEYSVIGHSVMVHAGSDDLSSDPSGAAGARIGCGVIAAN